MKTYNNTGMNEKVGVVDGKVISGYDEKISKAKFYEKKGEYNKAAKLYEASGSDYGILTEDNFKKAGDLYKLAGNYKNAVRAYRKAEVPSSLGYMIWSETGNLKKAAKAYAREGKFFKAGTAYKKMGMLEKAVKLFEMDAKENKR